MSKAQKSKIITIPNMLSMVRLLLIPVIVWLYCVKQEYIWTVVVLVLSALTDMVDGYIARHFNMVSDIGKALDPIADKLTQVATMFCLTTKFPLIWIPVIVLVVKEVLNALFHLMVMKKTGVVYGADWHGKLTTCLLYATMILHVLWAKIPMVVSNVCIILCLCMMLVSMVLYTSQNLKRIREAD